MNRLVVLAWNWPLLTILVAAGFGAVKIYQQKARQIHMRRVLKLIFAVALTATVLGIGADTSTATPTDHAAAVSYDHSERVLHNQDNYTTFYCTKHRTNSLHTIIHAVYYYLDPNVAGIYCQEQFFTVRRQYWVHVDLPLNSNVSWEPWDKQECKPTGPFPCDEP